MVGVGNALYHCGGAALVFSEKTDKAYPCGVFVSSGAMGLFLAMFFSKIYVVDPSVMCRILCCILLVGVLFLLLTAPLHKYDTEINTNSKVEKSMSNSPIVPILVFILLFIVVCRSFLGFTFNFP